MNTLVVEKITREDLLKGREELLCSEAQMGGQYLTGGLIHKLDCQKNHYSHQKSSFLYKILKKRTSLVEIILDLDGRQCLVVDEDLERLSIGEELYWRVDDVLHTANLQFAHRHPYYSQPVQSFSLCIIITFLLSTKSLLLHSLDI